MLMNAEQLKQAREWISECQWGDVEPEDVVDLTDEQVERGIRRHYEGGVAQFLSDGAPPALAA